MFKANETFDDEYRRQLVTHLEERSKSFKTLFKTSAVFTFAFLAFILIPFVALERDGFIAKREIAQNTKEQEEKKTKREEVSIRIKEYQSNIAKCKVSLNELNKEEAMKQQSITKLEGRLNDIRDKIARSDEEFKVQDEKRVALLQRQERFDRLPRYNIKQNVEVLRASLDDVYRDYKDTFADDEVAPRTLNEFVKDKSKEIIEDQLKEYRSIMADLKGDERINQSILKVLQTLDKLVAEDPEFWHTVHGKGSFFEKIKTPMEDVANEVARQMDEYRQLVATDREMVADEARKLKQQRGELEEQFKRETGSLDKIKEEAGNLRNKIPVLEAENARISGELERSLSENKNLGNELNDLKTALEKISKEKQRLEERIEKVQLPFAALPVGLNEAILAFPVIIAIGILMYGFVLGDLIRLRWAYHQAMLKKEPEATDVAVSTIAPIWLDPVAEDKRNLWRGLLVCVPVLAYLFALVLIFYSWSIESTRTSSTSVIRCVYVVFYLLGFVGFAVFAARIRHEWGLYTKRLKAESIKRSLKI